MSEYPTSKEVRYVHVWNGEDFDVRRKPNAHWPPTRKATDANYGQTFQELVRFDMLRACRCYCSC